MTTFSVITANVYNKNPNIKRDARLLVKAGALCIGLNEAGGFQDVIKEIAEANGYDMLGEGQYGTTSILLRKGCADIEEEVRQTAVAAGGTQANRRGRSVKFTYQGERLAVLNIHLNAGAQHKTDLSRPRDLPADQIKSYVDSIKAVTRWVKELEGEGRKVIVLGDLNWAYKVRGRAWRWSPQKAFRRRAGMVSQFADEMLKRPTDDKRAIEYVFYSPRDFFLVGQSFVGPESSDHPFHKVVLSTRRCG